MANVEKAQCRRDARNGASRIQYRECIPSEVAREPCENGSTARERARHSKSGVSDEGINSGAFNSKGF